MHQYLFDITVLGSAQVGKKTFAKCKFLRSFTDQEYMVTIGADISLKTVEIDETIVELRFRIFSCARHWWDKTRKGNLGILVRGANGAIILYDLTNSKSLELIPQWIQIVKDNAGNIPILLVGNKLDLTQQREISQDDIESIKEKYRIISSMEISVKTGENMDNMFLNLATIILKNIKINKLDRSEVDEYKNRMRKYINQAENGVNLPNDHKNLAESVEPLKNAINAKIRKKERNETIVYGYVLLIRCCLDLLKEPILLTDKKKFQTNIDQAYKSIHDILRRDKSIVYNTHVIMGMFLGIDQTRQFENKYKVKAPIARPILPKNWFLYAVYLIIVIAILIFLKVLLPT